MKFIYITGVLASIFAVTAIAAPPLAAREEAIPEMTRYYGKDVEEVTEVEKREEAVPEMTRYYGQDIDEALGTSE
jgi:DNA-binding NtrC family response regulator